MNTVQLSLHFYEDMFRSRFSRRSSQLSTSSLSLNIKHSPKGRKAL